MGVINEALAIINGVKVTKNTNMRIITQRLILEGAHNEVRMIVMKITALQVLRIKMKLIYHY